MNSESSRLEDIPPTGKTDELQALVRRRRLLLDEISKAVTAEETVKKRARESRLRKTQPLESELKLLDARLKTLLVGRRRYFWNRFGKTISLPDGVIRYRTDSKSLDTPKNTAKIVDYLVKMRGGNRYLTWTPTLDRHAITQASESLHRRLRHLGLWVGRHAIITIKSTGQDEPTTLDRRRYPQRHF